MAREIDGIENQHSSPERVEADQKQKEAYRARLVRVRLASVAFVATAITVIFISPPVRPIVEDHLDIGAAELVFLIYLILLASFGLIFAIQPSLVKDLAIPPNQSESAFHVHPERTANAAKNTKSSNKSSLEARSNDELIERLALARLSDYIVNLGLRANRALFYGIVFSLCGLGFVLYFVFQPVTFVEKSSIEALEAAISDVTKQIKEWESDAGNEGLPSGATAFIDFVEATEQLNLVPTDTTSVFLHFAPRASIVLLLELVSFFFLKLHIRLISELKYAQNEMTNLEVRFIAIRLAEKSGVNEHMIETIAKLMSIDRNGIIEKGQTTIDIERERAKSEDGIGTINAISALLHGNERGWFWRKRE